LEKVFEKSVWKKCFEKSGGERVMESENEENSETNISKISRLSKTSKISRNDVLEFLERENVEFVRPVFVDVLGRMIDFTVPLQEVEDLITEGKGFDGSSVEGFARIEESDLVFRPDLNTLRILPWEYKGSEKTWKEAIVFGHVFKPDKTLFE